MTIVPPARLLPAPPPLLLLGAPPTPTPYSPPTPTSIEIKNMERETIADLIAGILQKCNNSNNRRDEVSLVFTSTFSLFFSALVLPFIRVFLNFFNSFLSRSLSPLTSVFLVFFLLKLYSFLFSFSLTSCLSCFLFPLITVLYLFIGSGIELYWNKSNLVCTKNCYIKVKDCLVNIVFNSYPQRCPFLCHTGTAYF